VIIISWDGMGNNNKNVFIQIKNLFSLGHSVPSASCSQQESLFVLRRSFVRRFARKHDGASPEERTEQLVAACRWFLPGERGGDAKASLDFGIASCTSHACWQTCITELDFKYY
jgi:hypothetical protein